MANRRLRSKTKAHNVCSVYLWLGRQDYEIRPVFRPSGHQQKTLMFKFAPGKFVEPAGSQTSSQAITNTHPGGYW
jgi:hypothetical protein